MNSKDVKHIHIEDSDCLAAMDHLYTYLNGELCDETTLAMVEHHLGHCKSCYSRAEIERKINARLKTGIHKTPESLQKKLKNLLDEF